MAAVLPTKGNLMATKRSRALAQTGYELMDRKRNILVREMMELMNTATEVQDEIDTVFSDAYHALINTTIKLGVCDRIAEAIPIDNSLEIQYRSVMGVELPHVPDHTPPVRMEYGFAFSNSALDDCYIKFYKVKDLVRRLAEIETAIYRLAESIKKTQKRANALQNIVIPGFDQTIRTISDTLEEKEREEFVKLKVVKRKKA